jgi:hypothetical protein
MQTIAKHVLEHAIGLPEGTPLVAKELPHLGNENELWKKAEEAEALAVHGFPGAADTAMVGCIFARAKPFIGMRHKPPVGI